MVEGSTAATWPLLLARLLRDEDLTPTQARWAMTQIMSGAATPAQTGAFLVALRAKGESVVELRTLADVMLEQAIPLEVAGPALDIVGTGGDQANTVNISTMAAIVAAGAGRQVVKHGNRAASSASGTADVLEELGIDLDLLPDRVAEVAQECGITFCFARAFHPAMRHVAPVRGELGVPTVFNVLGPLTNPARPQWSAIGCGNLTFAPLLAGVFAERGRSALIFRGQDGLDELTLTTPTDLWWVDGGHVHHEVITPEDVGLPRCELADLVGGDATANAQVVRDLLAGKTGPVRDAVVLNAGAALALANAQGARPADIAGAVRDGIEQAQAAIDSGSASRVLAGWVAASGGQSGER